MARFGLPVVGAIVLVSVGALATALLVQPGPPASLVEGTAPTAVPVTTTEFRDERAVKATATFATDRSLVAPVGGRITAFGCRIGTPIGSGGTLVSVDGVPVLSLATSVPLWRDIRSGDEGADVAALQSELQRLGLPVEVDGDAGAGTIAAVEQLLTSIGAPRDIEGLPLSSVLWLPSPEVVPATCDAAVGDQTSPGTAIAQLPPGLDAIVIDALPQDLLDGERELLVGPVTVRMSSGQTAIEAAELARPELLAAVGRPESGNSVTVQATFSLAEPVEVAVVPPASVLVDGDRTCVFVGGNASPVTIVGSQLGETFVRFDADVPSSVDVRPAPAGSCR